MCKSTKGLQQVLGGMGGGVLAGEGVPRDLIKGQVLGEGREGG